MTAKRATRPSPLRRAALALDQDPGGSWVAALVHHGSRLALLFLTAVAIYGLFPAPRLPDTAVLERGAVAPSDVIAEFDFDIPKSADELVKEQVEAASSVSPIYDLHPDVTDSAVQGLDAFFAAIDSLVSSAPEEEQTEALADYLEANRVTPTPATLQLLLNPSRRDVLHRETAGAVREHYPTGVAPSALGQNVTSVFVRHPDGTQRYVLRDSVLTPDRFFSIATQEASGSDPDAAELQRLLLIRFFQPSLVPNEAATEAARERARAAVDPVETSSTPAACRAAC